MIYFVCRCPGCVNVISTLLHQASTRTPATAVSASVTLSTATTGICASPTSRSATPASTNVRWTPSPRLISPSCWMLRVRTMEQTNERTNEHSAFAPLDPKINDKITPHSTQLSRNIHIVNVTHLQDNILSASLVFWPFVCRKWWKIGAKTKK